MSKFDFKNAVAQAKARMEDKKLNAIVLAPSGGGKSSLAGTLGVPTLYLHLSAESHGPIAASTFSTGDVDPVCIDDGRTPDEALEFLQALLNDKEFLSGYDAIALDSATSLEQVIRNSDNFRARCISEKTGKVNSFAEPAAVLTIFSEIIRLLQATGKHTILTLALDVKAMDGETGEILEAMPKLSTYSVAESIIMQFGDVFIIGPMTKGDKTAHRIQFSGKVSKTSKDASGNVKKFINFSPRVTGVKVLPDSLPAKLSEVVKLKKEGK
jgi:hypothetical protein